MNDSPLTPADLLNLRTDPMNAQEAHISLLREALYDILDQIDDFYLNSFGISRERSAEIRALVNEGPTAEQIATRRAEFSPDGALEPELPLVEFLTGNGTGGIMLPVSYIADFACGPDHRTCAFCQGDPCAEASPPDAPISLYFQASPNAEACPFCLGRAS